MEFTNTIDTLELIGQLVRDQYRGQLKKMVIYQQESYIIQLDIRLK